MTAHQTSPKSGRVAPGLPAASQAPRILNNWAHQSGHLHALQLLDTVLTFRERGEASGHRAVQADRAVLEGFLSTLRPAFEVALPMLSLAERAALLDTVVQELLAKSASLMQYRPVAKGAR
jgi:hypothetical protein